MPQPVVCPDLAQYQYLAAGKLAEADEEALLEHLEHCNGCAQKLNTLPEPDTLVELIRREQGRGNGPAGEVIARLVEHLSKLRPGQPKAGAEQTVPPREQVVPPQLTFACSACGKSVKVKVELAGKKVKCPHCKEPVRVPAVAVGTLAPEPGSQREKSTLGGVNSLSRVTDSRTDQPRPAGDANKQHYDFLASPQAPDELGRLGPYRVLQVLGAGGMGVVFRAEDPQLQRLVALKAMLPGLAASDSAKQRFLREARAAAALKHDHIVTIHQVGEDRGAPFLAMEFLEGECLEDRLKRDGKLPLAEVLRIGREMAEGLAAAHDHGLIHRDIKPANVWLEGKKGRVKILDFGLARAVGQENQLTQQGAIIGTPAYMAPEQAQGLSLDGRCDLFSLGCVLYRMATGEAPFSGTDVISTLMAVATHKPPPPHQLDATLPPALSELVMGLLAKGAWDRPTSAQAVAETLEGIARQSVSRSQPEGIRSAKNQGRSKARVRPAFGGRRHWVMALAIVLLLGFGGWFLAPIVFKTRVRTVNGEAFVVLEIEQAGAEVFVDGDRISVTVPGDNKPVEIRVEPGQHKLRISKDGFVAVTRDMELKIGKSDPIRVRLEAVPKADPKEVPATVPADALRRADIPEAVLAWLGGGDPKRAPPELVAVLGDVQRHTAKVRGLVFSCDGRWLASASMDRSVILWETATGRARRVLRGHSGPIKSVAFSKDGRTLVAASLDGTLIFWPTEKDAEPETVKPDLGEIFALAASADGRFLAAGGKNGTIMLWKWGQWNKPTTLATLPGPLWSLAFTPDGELLASGWGVAGLGNGNWAGTSAIRLYKTADGQLTHTLPGHPEKTLPDGQQIGEVRYLSVSRDGKILASVGTDNKVKVWDLASGKSIAEFQHGFHHGARVTISPDSKTLAATDGAGVAIVDLAAATRKAGTDAVRGFADVWGLAFSPDGKRLAVGDEIGNVFLYNTTDWKLQKRSADPGHTREVYSVAFSPDGRWLASGSADNTVRVWDLATGTPRHKLEGHKGLVWSVAFSPDGKILASGSHDGTIALWDSVTGARVHTLRGRSHESSVRFSPDGKFVAAGTADGGVQMWYARNGEEARRLRGMHEGRVRCLAFCADGQRLATGGDDGKLVITDLASGKVLQAFKRNTAVFSVEFGADGETVAAGYAPPEAVGRLWNLKDKDFVSLKGHTDRVSTVSLRSDGRLAATTSLDGSVRLWEIGGNAPRKMVLGVGSVGEKLWMGALSPDGRYVATGNSNGTIYLFRLPGPAENIGEWLAARTSVPRGLSPEAWLERVRSLYVGNVPDAISDRLRELNPSFDGPLAPVIEDGVVTELQFWTDNATDIAPVGALTGLRKLNINGSGVWFERKGKVADLSPLKDMKLTTLSCEGTQVSDLSPLKDVKLIWLNCAATRVSELSPLKHMKLTRLVCNNTEVSDLSPLKGMPLKELYFQDTKIADLTPLKDMKLTFLNCGSTKVSSLAALKDMKLTGLACYNTQVSDLAPLKGMPLTELSFYGTQVSELTPLKDMKLAALICQRTQLTAADLAPLQGMSSLRRLQIGGPKMTEAGLAHLKKLADLEFLAFTDTKLTEAGLVNLKGMTRLQQLDLHNTELTDEGLVHLKGLLGLRELRLEQSRVTDAGLEHLAGLKNLAELHLKGTAVTDKGVAKLKAALPKCNITR